MCSAFQSDADGQASLTTGGFSHLEGELRNSSFSLRIIGTTGSEPMTSTV